jgi:uncharacterized protein
MERTHYLERIELILKIHPICAILGLRQVGKTTLARMYIERYHQDNVLFFDLENPLHLAELQNPMLALSNRPEQLIVIDEIQRRPELFPILRVIVDEPTHKKQKFLILGSASRDLIRQSSETLAGRIGYLELTPFSLEEVKDSSRLWLRGGLPKSYLAESDNESYLWRQNYITTFLERDIPNLGFTIPAEQMRRYWLMLSHYHGQIFNASEIARSLAVSHHTVQKYLDLLIGTFMVRRLMPWFENIQKRQVRSPKIYIRDSGILNALLLLSTENELRRYPRLGAFWEGFALEQLVDTLDVAPQECFFWATHVDAELDLLIFKGGRRLGFEFKYTDSPHATKSMYSAKEILKLDHIALIYPGKAIFPIDYGITAYGLETIATGEFQKKYSVALS